MKSLEEAHARICEMLKTRQGDIEIKGSYPVGQEILKENALLIHSVEKAQSLCDSCDGLHCLQQHSGMVPTLDFNGDIVTESFKICPKVMRKNTKLQEISNIPKRYLGKTFDDIDVLEGNQMAINALKWCLLNQDAEKNGVFLHGSSGTGKTLISLVFAQESIKKGVETLFIPVIELLNKIRKSYSDNSQSFNLDTVLNVPCLILDDLGAQRMNAWVASELYMILNYRYMYMLQTVITSNYSLNNLLRNMQILSDNGILKDDENIGAQIISRIAGMCHCVEVRGVDQRFSQKGVKSG